MFHGNLGEQRHSRQPAPSAKLSAVQSRSQRRICGEIVWRRDVLLHQWKVVYRWNSVKEDVLLWSRNALHLLQAEFCSFILMSVYINPQVQVSLDLQKLTDQIKDTEQKHPDSVLIVLGDFNKAHLSVNCQNTDSMLHVPPETLDNILDHCYTIIKDAYHSVSRAALRLSDHCLVHLIPTYRQKLKSAKTVLRTVKRWTNEAERVLQACFDLTDWSVFEAAATDLDELIETVTSHISFCEDMCIPTRTHLTYNNDKPWFTAKLRQLSRNGKY